MIRLFALISLNIHSFIVSYLVILPHVQLKADVVERLRVVDETLESGTSALVALILHGRLYIAHVGMWR